MQKESASRLNHASVALLIALLCGCGHQKTPVHEPIPVRVIAAENSPENSSLRYSANIDAFTQVSLSFKSAGYVDRIIERTGADGRMRILQVGDRVTQGEVLAHVRESEYVDRVSSAQAQIDQAQADFEKARLDFDRAVSLYKSDSYTKTQYDAAKSSFDASSALVESAKAAWEQAKTSLTDCSLHSPLNGWVLSRQVEVGALVANGSPAFVLADTHFVKAVFGVPDTRVNNVKLGAPQTITTTSLPEEFHGRITSVSPSADEKSRVFSVEVTIPNPDDRLRPGMIATLNLRAGTPHPPVIVVPLSAVIRSTQHPDGFAVFVVSQEGGKTLVHERSVEIGDTLSNSISIAKGLHAGEQVVMTGSALIKDGDEIKVIP